MIPILYEPYEMEFDNNGLGRLRDAISVEVVEERNGIYECNFSYPVTGASYDKIQLGRIIAVKHDGTDDIQPFDIVSCSRAINGIVEFHAVHVSYRQRFMTVTAKNISSITDAFDALATALPANPFEYESDVNGSGYVASLDGVPRSVRSVLGGTEGSLLDAYGGEYEFDKFTVRLWASRGQTRNFAIRYGVNMVDYNEELDYSESYTSVVPFWTNTESGETVRASAVSSGVAPYNGIESVVPLDLSEKFENKPTASDLTTAAQSYMTANKPYLPAQSITVNFMRLQDSSEYAQFAPLLECKLCDTIRVYMPRYNMSGDFKIVKTVYDVLLERFTEMELGTLSTSLSEALGIGQSESKGNGSADYVTEFGSNGVWQFRKWNSGRVEAWGYVATSASVTGASWGSMYYYDLAVTIPSGIFETAPTRAYATSRNLQWSPGGFSGLTATSCTIRFVRPVSSGQLIQASVYLASF